ncbi:MAG: AraC family transcriptional regulator [Acetobacteraceae bacterium]
MKPILIVADHSLVAEATGQLLGALSDEFEVVLAGSAGEALECVNSRIWFRILLDLDVPGAYGLSLARDIELLNLAERCWIVSASDGADLVSHIAARGFAGYIVKAAPVADFTAAMLQFLSGNASFPNSNASLQNPPPWLTRRQLDILQRVSVGESSEDVSCSIQITDRHRRAIRFTEPLWSSASTAWQGFPMERHGVGPVGRLSNFSLPEVLLGVCTTGAAIVEVGDRPQTRRTVMRESNFILLDRGDAQQAVAWRGMRETLYVWLVASMIEQLLPGVAERGRLHVHPQYAASDAQVTRLTMCMHDEAMDGCPGGAAYAQSLSLALARYVVARFGSGRADARNGNVFSRTKSARLQGYLEANLATNMSLTELAALVGLSAHHFVQVFKNTFDATPHQYMLHLRIERAKRLLEGDCASISDVGLSVGFCDQSHFTRIFRRLTGRTPTRFRRDASQRHGGTDQGPP